VQLDEPALVADRTGDELTAIRRAYHQLGELVDRPQLLVATYFGDIGESLPALAETPVDGIAIDLVRGHLPDTAALAGKTVFAGVVSGREVWRTDLDGALGVLLRVREMAAEVVVSTSCSLLHVPYSLAAETGLESGLRHRLAFAEEKVAEVVLLADRLARTSGTAGSGTILAEPSRPRAHTGFAVPAQAGRSPYPVRAEAQAQRLRLPPLPVTTTGSFPQTDELRAARAAVAGGRMDDEQYERRIAAEIERVIRLQERLGLDVLVHGEPERNDMVQYFAEHLDGFATTHHGWVQSYGSRCTRPPILHDTVSRPVPITVRWARYAQSLTTKPVKGMLTGPVTIVAWSFVRNDLPLREVVDQVAEAIRGEVTDLEAAGICVIQVDEPALRELMPLRRDAQAEYLQWAVDAYRHATSGAGDRTQIHTHLCYSETGEVLAAIDSLDADVTTVESARSGARLLAEPAIKEFSRGLGPGVYDIHSPRVPGTDEVADLLATALGVIPADRVWVNPDCGLKTRTYPEIEAALRNVVSAAHRMRAALTNRAVPP
jgi:5-methyltetrahydropteroyltriglutamate--homocysteine methyltransferase